MCQDALNGSSRLRETRRASPPTHPTSSRPKPKAWVGPVARGAPPPHMGPYGPRKMHRTTLNYINLGYQLIRLTALSYMALLARKAVAVPVGIGLPVRAYHTLLANRELTAACSGAASRGATKALKNENEYVLQRSELGTQHIRNTKEYLISSLISLQLSKLWTLAKLETVGPTLYVGSSAGRGVALARGQRAARGERSRRERGCM